MSRAVFGFGAKGMRINWREILGLQADESAYPVGYTLVFIRILIIRIGWLVFLGGAAFAAEEMAVERLDSALDKLIPADAMIEVLSEGFNRSDWFSP